MDPGFLMSELRVPGSRRENLARNLSSLSERQNAASAVADTEGGNEDWNASSPELSLHAWEGDRLRSILKDFHPHPDRDCPTIEEGAADCSSDCLTPRAVRAIRKFGGSRKLENWLRHHGQCRHSGGDSAGAVARYKQHIVDSSVQGLTVGLATLFLVFQSPECSEEVREFYGDTLCLLFSVVYFLSTYLSVALLLIFTYKCIYMFLGAPFGDALGAERQVRLLILSDIRSLSFKLRSSLIFLGLAIPFGVAMTSRPIFALIALVVTAFSFVHVKRWQQIMDFGYAHELVQEAKVQIDSLDLSKKEELSRRGSSSLFGHMTSSATSPDRGLAD